MLMERRSLPKARKEMKEEEVVVVEWSGLMVHLKIIVLTEIYWDSLYHQQEIEDRSKAWRKYL